MLILKGETWNFSYTCGPIQPCLLILYYGGLMVMEGIATLFKDSENLSMIKYLKSVIFIAIVTLLNILLIKVCMPLIIAIAF